MGWSTEAFADNANANALRWGTLYSFWFDSEKPVTRAVIGLFKPGAPGAPTEKSVELTAPVAPAPAAVVAAPAGAWAEEGARHDRNVGTNPTFRLSCRPGVDRELEAVASSLPGLQATAKKGKDDKGVVYWDVTVEHTADAKKGYFEGAVTFKTKTPGDRPLTVRVFGEHPGK
jgi:hypothetical protein